MLAPKTEAPGAAPVADADAKKERKALYWTDPMVPGFKSDKPGKSPFVDMELVPVYEDEAGAAVVSVRPGIVQNLGVRTYTVARGSQPRRVTVTGYVFRDARGLAVLVDLINRDASFVRAGQRAEVRVADVPDRAWDGTVETVEPDVDIGARTLSTRAPGPRGRRPEAQYVRRGHHLGRGRGQTGAVHPARGADPHRLSQRRGARARRRALSSRWQ